MNFFDQFVIPPTENHIALLKYMLVVSLLLFLPYLGMSLGANLLWAYFDGKAKKTKSTLFSRFSKDILQKLTISKNAAIALGIVPVISASIAYGQLLFVTGSVTVNFFFFSVLIFIIGYVLLRKYLSALPVARFLEEAESEIKQPEAKEELHQLEEEYIYQSGYFPKLSLLSLMFGAYIFAGSAGLALNPARWSETDNLLQIIYSWNTVFDFLLLLAFSFAITGAAILFFFFRWQGGIENMSDKYAMQVKSYAGGVSLISVSVIPVLLLISTFLIQQHALISSSFLYLFLILIAVIITCSMLYFIYKEENTGLIVPVFLLIFVIFALNILREQEVFAGALSGKMPVMIKKSEEHEKEVRSKIVSKTGLDGEQIYNTKCIACHKFDQKLVGPPHKDVVPKYNGDVNKLAEYIFNPTKVDPAYPPMPNPGLKKKEAVAVAQYLINKISGK
jgi:cytochrome c